MNHAFQLDIPNSQVYLVGGAIRDQLLKLTVKDRDYVVIGATPEQMQQQGFIAVGKDFPVFLHPTDKTEYALARTETKTTQGHQGFSFQTGPNISLEQDLKRRDLTINAIAQDQHGHFIDPYGGIDDLKNKILRHVSPAFAEDPLRVLRVARFLARFKHLGFRIHPQTIQLMQQLTASGELQTLTPERVWQEIKNSLNTTTPSAFFTALRKVKALAIILPELDALFGVPQPKKWHPEIDSGIHAMLAIDQAATYSNDVAFAVMLHDLGKGITPKHILPSHRGHEKAGVPLVKAVCERLKVPKKYRNLALKICRWHFHAHIIAELTPKKIDQLFIDLDGYRQPQMIEKFIQACRADSTGRLGYQSHPYPQAQQIRSLFQAAQNINRQPITTTHSGKQIGEQLRLARIQAIKQQKQQLFPRP